MKQLLLVAVSGSIGSLLTALVLAPRAVAGGGQDGGVEKCVTRNGDVDADGTIKLTDAVTILGHLFLGNPTDLLPLCPSIASPVPATGQTQCYDADGGDISCGTTCTGQDSEYRIGCPPQGRFFDNDDGTVTDSCTGLTWQKDTGNDRFEWCAGLEYCESLELAGHTDWRLPSITELLSIVEFGRTGPATDSAFVVLSGFYWSSTSYELEPEYAWGLDFADGSHGSGLKHDEFYVRAVRSVDSVTCTAENGDINADGIVTLTDAITILNNLFLGSLAEFAPRCGLLHSGQVQCFDEDGSPVTCDSDICFGQDALYAIGCGMVGRFADDGDGTVTDKCTALMWQKSTANEGIKLQWCDALEYCESLELAGHTDWRLPNINELLSLVDFSTPKLAINSLFEDLPSTYLSSTSREFEPDFAWGVAFHVGYHTWAHKSTLLYFRAVRSAPR